MCHSEQSEESYMVGSESLIWKILRRRLLRMTMVVLLLTFNFSFLTSRVFAQQDLIGQARIDASSPIYFLKSVREIIELKFAPSTHVKAIRYLEFATRRVREVKSLTSNSQEVLIPPTLEKYWSNLRSLLGLINITEKARVKEVTGVIEVHIDNLLSVYSQTSHPKARMSIRTTIYRLTKWNEEFARKVNSANPFLVGDLNLKRQNLKGCNFLLKEASSSALNDTEKLVLDKRAEDCFKAVEFDKRLKVD